MGIEKKERAKNTVSGVVRKGERDKKNWRKMKK